VPKTAGGRKCPFIKKNGERCGQAAGLGTDHLGWGNCKFHGGSSPSHGIKARREMAEEAAATFGLSIRVDPMRALVEELWRTAGHVAWLKEQIEGLPGADDLLYLTEQGLKPRAFLDVYHREREHLTKVARACLEVGIAERQVKLAEEQGALVAMAIRAILDDLQLSPEQAEAAPGIVRRHLSAIPTEEAS
jgi:hypothetical protein